MRVTIGRGLLDSNLKPNISKSFCNLDFSYVERFDGKRTNAFGNERNLFRHIRYIK